MSSNSLDTTGLSLCYSNKRLSSCTNDFS